MLIAPLILHIVFCIFEQSHSVLFPPQDPLISLFEKITPNDIIKTHNNKINNVVRKIILH